MTGDPEVPHNADTEADDGGITSAGLVAPRCRCGCCCEPPYGQARYLPPPAATNPIPNDDSDGQDV